MEYLKRTLAVALPSGQSAFLWGPRKTGKSLYLKMLYPKSIVYDLLDTDLALELAKRPALLREQLSAENAKRLAEPIIIDEIQKVPRLMDEVHWLIENKGLRFILCGSSARKLRRGGANLLGGRAWRYAMFPLVTPEIPEPDLLRILNRGTIPAHYLGDDHRKSLAAYVRDYLKEEVFAEGLARNVPAFARFFDAVGYTHGELTNFANIARDCGVSAKTVKEYYQILADTLIGSFVEPFHRRPGRNEITSAPKFYLFDVGVAGIIAKRAIPEERGEIFGKAFEHFIYTEIRAHASYRGLDYDINFWRTKAGLEVDFVLGGGRVAVEVKGTTRVDNQDLRPLRRFVEDHAPEKAMVVANEKNERCVGDIRIMPWRIFLERLWAGEIIA